ncbi:uncharacterized protein [Antennarius striatus]|uniref:uncharacterized protein n=1 Tax=Antennarius striatus TaxID=241820 RepID=UPI0035B453D4
MKVQQLLVTTIGLLIATPTNQQNIQAKIWGDEYKATDGPDPEFNIRVCVLSPKTIPSVVGGNPALPAAKRLIAPAVIPPVPHDDPSHFGSTWTIHDDENDPNHPSPFHAKLWWKYANLTAHKANKSGCYVCSILPHAVSQPHLYASPLSETHSLSILNQTLGLTSTDPNAPRYTNLRRAMSADPHPQAGWLDWLFTGTWSQVLVKIIFPFVAVVILSLLTCAFCSCCVIPMSKRMMSQVFVAHLHAYNLVKIEDIDSDIDEELSSI